MENIVQKGMFEPKNRGWYLDRAAFQELTESDLSAVEGRKLFFDAQDKCPEVISYFYGCDFSGIGIEFDPDCCPNLEETVDMVICL